MEMIKDDNYQVMLDDFRDGKEIVPQIIGIVSYTMLYIEIIDWNHL